LNKKKRKSKAVNIKLKPCESSFMQYGGHGQEREESKRGRGHPTWVSLLGHCATIKAESNGEFWTSRLGLVHQSRKETEYSKRRGDASGIYPLAPRPPSRKMKRKR